MNNISCYLLFIFISTYGISQDFNYYHIGDTTDIQTSPAPGICLMGGASENDQGSSWFLDRADGGNIVVIRASGTDAYNDYFFNQLGSTVQSVETIVFNNGNASYSSFVLQRIEAAEAIWIAGGDQFIYEEYWKGSPVENLINQHVGKGFPIGGTSAGMAILGSHYFNAENGTVTSNTALNDPLNNDISISDNFLTIPFLENTITDTHYDNPNRKGRHSVFIAHMQALNGGINFGIAAEEYVAICINENGVATIYGEYPAYEDFAYFIRTNCTATAPSIFTEGAPLHWNPQQRNALEVCKMEATSNGNQKFDLNLWKNNNGGTWNGWNIENGSLVISNSSYESCDLQADNLNDLPRLMLHPQPANEKLFIKSENPIESISLFNTLGKRVMHTIDCSEIGVSHLNSGIYTLLIKFNNGDQKMRRVSVQR